MDPNGLIVMGVSGCGKTSVGKALAAHLGWTFYDADDFHPAANKAKMAAGIPLDDTDRAPWLRTLHDLLADQLADGAHPILACSALKQSYRDELLDGNRGLKVIYLKGSFDLIWVRMKARKHHYMKANMLKSQFTALEEPQDALVVDITPPVEVIAGRILAELFQQELKQAD
jgi:gluconokinase